MAALILICFLVGQIAAAPLPGVKWSALEIWEGSAAADVWLYASDYLDFRKYALSGLSDLGFLDHLLRLFPGTLRVISGFGKPTGMVCTLLVAGARLRQRRRDRGRRRGRSYTYRGTILRSSLPNTLEIPSYAIYDTTRCCRRA